MNETETISSLQVQMDDLATGQLGMFAAWRLRRRIARDPSLTREFAEIQKLRTEMQSLVRRSAPYTTSPATLTIGGLTMKRRTVLAATAALTFVTVTGAVAARHYLDLTPHSSFTDNQGHPWDIRTNLPGTIRLFNPEGKLIGQMTTDGGFPRGSDIVLVTYAGQQDSTVHGYGKHLLRNTKGTILGSVEIAPFSAQDKASQKTASEQNWSGLEALYREPNTFATADSGGREGVLGAIGLTAGYRTDEGLSWKMIGYASVTAEYVMGGKSELQTGKGGPLPSLDITPLPMRTLLTRLGTLAPAPGTAPQIYWQRVGKDHTIHRGAWCDLQDSGKFTGYGRHEVKDKNGKTILVLTVAPLTSSKWAR
jgi:hypothetical protein